MRESGGGAQLPFNSLTGSICEAGSAQMLQKHRGNAVEGPVNLAHKHWVGVKMMQTSSSSYDDADIACGLQLCGGAILT